MCEHVLRKKVYYHDTDAGGVVYYANYLKHLEEARHEFLLSKGLDLKKASEQGVLFVVKCMNIDYKKPAFYGQEIEVHTSIQDKKRVSLTFHQVVSSKSDVLVKAEITLCCVNKSFFLIDIPDIINL